MRTDLAAIVLFDGVCNLCNGAVQFIIRHDPDAYFRFASLQSEAGRELLARHDLDTNSLHSIILIEGNHVYEKSEAALRVASRLRGLRWISWLRIVPRFLRDLVYDGIAHSRYRIFGKRDECMLPTPELRDRFMG